MHRENIEKYVDENRETIIENIKRLVRIPSTKGETLDNMPFGEGPDNALKEALKIGEELGFTVKNYDGYVGTIDFAPDSPAQLDILAHLDVVPAPAEEWTVTQPFEPVVKDGKIYGRGTSDDKGPAVAALIAMKAVKDLGIPLKKNVRLILGTDEESGSEDIAYYYAKEKQAPMTFSPDASFPVINVEKGRFSGTVKANFSESDKLPKVISMTCGVRTNVVPDQATIEIKGLTMQDLTPVADKWSADTNVNYSAKEENGNIILNIKGLGGHAAEPDVSRNAATASLDLISRLPIAESDSFTKIKNLSKLFPYGDWKGNAAGIQMNDDISGDLTISLNIVNIDESGFSARFDSRTALCATKENTLDILRKNIENADLLLSEYTTEPAHHIPEDSPFVQTLLSVYEKYSGRKGECLAIGGGTYVHGLENAVAFGATLPETNGNIHGADEFAVIDELLLSTKIFAQVIVDLCS